jgi:actin-like ATPase involved in cell morphogenesis
MAKDDVISPATVCIISPNGQGTILFEPSDIIKRAIEEANPIQQELVRVTLERPLAMMANILNGILLVGGESGIERVDALAETLTNFALESIAAFRIAQRQKEGSPTFRTDA